MDEPSTAIVLYRSDDARARAQAWAALGDATQKRAAMEAARDHDAPALWELTQTWLILHGRKGATVGLRTLHSYREALLPRLAALPRPAAATGTPPATKATAKGTALLDAWASENLLHPAREAGTRWLRGLEATGCAPSTVRVYLAGARALYAALCGAGATTADPFKDLHPAPDPVPRWEKRQPYSDAEVTALLAHADGPDRVVVLLGAHAGLRVSEMVALRWADVDLTRQRLVVQSGKGGKKRTVPLSTSLASELGRSARAPGEGVGGAPGEGVGGAPGEGGARVLPYKDRLAVWYRLRALARRAGVTPLGVHSLRHYAGTRLTRENNGNLRPTQKMLGHESIVTSEIYAAWSDESLGKQLKSW